MLEMYNNAALIVKLGATLDGTEVTPRRPTRRRIEPNPCLIERLPLTGEFLEYYSTLSL